MISTNRVPVSNMVAKLRMCGYVYYIYPYVFGFYVERNTVAFLVFTIFNISSRLGAVSS